MIGDEQGNTCKTATCTIKVHQHRRTTCHGVLLVPFPFMLGVNAPHLFIFVVIIRIKLCNALITMHRCSPFLAIAAHQHLLLITITRCAVYALHIFVLIFSFWLIRSKIFYAFMLNFHFKGAKPNFLKKGVTRIDNENGSKCA